MLPETYTDEEVVTTWQSPQNLLHTVYILKKFIIILITFY